MFKFKFLISLVVFSFLLFGTSIIKNQTREIEKKNFYFKQRSPIKTKRYQWNSTWFYLFDFTSNDWEKNWVFRL